MNNLVNLSRSAEEIFVATKMQRTAIVTGGGSGIGLALSRRLVEMMDGSLDVESGPGAGAVFTLELPLAGSREHDGHRVAGAARDSGR